MKFEIETKTILEDPFFLKEEEEIKPKNSKEKMFFKKGSQTLKK